MFSLSISVQPLSTSTVVICKSHCHRADAIGALIKRKFLGARVLFKILYKLVQTKTGFVFSWLGTLKELCGSSPGFGFQLHSLAGDSMYIRFYLGMSILYIVIRWQLSVLMAKTISCLSSIWCNILRNKFSLLGYCEFYTTL